MTPELIEALGRDLEFRLKYKEAKARQKAVTIAIDGLKRLSDNFQKSLHSPHPHKTFTIVIAEFEIELVGINAQIKRFETIGK